MKINQTKRLKNNFVKIKKFLKTGYVYKDDEFCRCIIDIISNACHGTFALKDIDLERLKKFKTFLRICGHKIHDSRHCCRTVVLKNKKIVIKILQILLEYF